MKISNIFGEKRIIGLAGERSTGKTNNLMALIEDFRKENKSTPIYYYGLEDFVVNWIKIYIKNSFEVSSLEQLSNKTDSLIILDEFQKLSLNDRRYKDLLNQFSNFIYHKNNKVILSSPDLREFNSVIGSKIEGWILKSLKLNSLINGSQLKNIVLNYKGRYKSINDLIVPKNEIIIINEEFEKIIKLDYINKCDGKASNKDIFVKELSKNCQRKSQKKGKKLLLKNNKKVLKSNKIDNNMEEEKKESETSEEEE